MKNHDQNQDETQDALVALDLARSDLDAAPSLDAWYDLAVACGRLRRLSGVGSAAFGPQLIEAEAQLATAPAGVLSALDEDALLGTLEAQLDDPEMHPVTLMTTLLEFDGYACAAHALGTPEAAAPLLEEARLLTALHAEVAAMASDPARAFVERSRIGPEHVAWGLWRAAADSPSAAQPTGPVEPAPSILTWLEQQAGGVVLPFRRAQAAEPALYRRAAAADDEAIEVESVEITRGGDRWILAFEVPVGVPELVLYTSPGDAVSFGVSVGGVSLDIHDDGAGRRSAALGADAARIDVKIGDESLTCRFPE